MRRSGYFWVFFLALLAFGMLCIGLSSSQTTTSNADLTPQQLALSSPSEAATQLLKDSVALPKAIDNFEQRLTSQADSLQANNAGLLMENSSLTNLVASSQAALVSSEKSRAESAQLLEDSMTSLVQVTYDLDKVEKAVAKLSLTNFLLKAALALAASAALIEGVVLLVQAQ